ncbi:MAG: CYTH domain-containing protein [Planctomycetota bacterium]|jgi:adenylate cyclase class IV
MQSLDFKAELRDPEIARIVCRHLGAIEVGTTTSLERYFRVANGRLKQRIAPDEPVEWIFYHRADRSKPKITHFTVYSDEQARARFGEQPLPTWLEFKRTREIWLIDWVRVNIDTIEGLGTFLELEAVVSKRRNVATCHKRFDELRRHFEHALGEPISHSYADLVALEQSLDETPEQSESPNL